MRIHIDMYIRIYANVNIYIYMYTSTYIHKYIRLHIHLLCLYFQTEAAQKQVAEEPAGGFRSVGIVARLGLRCGGFGRLSFGGFCERKAGLLPRQSTGVHRLKGRRMRICREAYVHVCVCIYTYTLVPERGSICTYIHIYV